MALGLCEESKKQEPAKEEEKKAPEPQAEEKKDDESGDKKQDKRGLLDQEGDFGDSWSTGYTGGSSDGWSGLESKGWESDADSQGWSSDVSHGWSGHDYGHHHEHAKIKEIVIEKEVKVPYPVEKVGYASRTANLRA